MAEVPGPTPEKIGPKVHHTARVLWGVYALLTLVETLLLRVGGVSWFDSICQSFATMATGGFSTRQAGIAHWNSPYVHYVIALFMLLAGTNFSVLWLLFRGRVAAARRNEEVKYYLLFVAVFTAIIWGGLQMTTVMGGEETFRHALFQVLSIMTTTGFATVDYLLWAPVLTIVLFALFFFGGSAGSTAGSIKIMRIVLLLKNSYYELRRMLHPSAVIPVHFNGHSVDTKTMNNILAFFMLYLIIFSVSSTAFMVFEPDLETAIGAVATSLGNIGPGLGSVGPASTFVHIHPAGKWLLSILMLLGRLELFTVLVLFSPSFWRK
jgi:trk system potassium uptake protein TrkH